MEPTRLIDGDGDGLELRLLGAARRDQPPAGAVARAIAAVGFAAGTASAGAGAAGAATVKVSASTASIAAIAKWLGVGAVVGFVASSGLRLAADPVLRARLFVSVASAGAAPAPRAPKAAPVSTVARAAPAAALRNAGDLNAPADPATASRRAADTPRAAEAKPPAAKVEALVKPRSVEQEAMTAANSAPAAEVPLPSIAVEIHLIELARQALLRHQPSDALRALDEYAAARRTGVLSVEAEVLRIEALFQAGQRDRALALAALALSNAPNGPHAARLREIIRRDQ